MANHAHPWTSVASLMAPLQLKLLLEILMWSGSQISDTAKIIAKPKEKRTFSRGLAWTLYRLYPMKAGELHESLKQSQLALRPHFRLSLMHSISAEFQHPSRPSGLLVALKHDMFQWMTSFITSSAPPWIRWPRLPNHRRGPLDPSLPSKP